MQDEPFFEKLFKNGNLWEKGIVLKVNRQDAGADSQMKRAD